MSYCVNCGVELEKTIKSCPLCGTEVKNPKQAIDTTSPTPYPQKRAAIEPVDRKETALLLTIVLLAPSIACLIINYLILRHGMWSLYVTGACAIVWTFFVPSLIFKNKLHNLLYVIFDALVVIAYMYVFVLQFGNNGWLEGIAIPIILLVSLLLLILSNIYSYYNPPIIVMTMGVIGAIGVFNIGVELILNLYFKHRIYIFWSAVVAICCIMIIIPLAIIISNNKLREEVRRRLHV
jgi:hypothetical protein